jgi:hypothetical protein
VEKVTVPRDWDEKVLGFDPFAGDKDDGGYKIKSDKIVTARKERRCFTCGGIVYHGTRVRVMTAIGPDGFVSSTDCYECCDAMALAVDGDDAEYCRRIDLHRSRDAQRTTP